ncbi:MAG: MarC family protein [Deltaproteobacteria bacterium]
MQNLLHHAISVFMAFFAIMNPIANTPIFLGLTAGDEKAIKRKIASQSLTLSFLIVLVSCLAGNLIFKAFGITLPAFRITGGILVFIIGFQMLHGSPSQVHNPSHADNRKSLEAELSIIVSPLAVPILAGPGTIATAISFSAHADLLYTFVTICVFALLCLITFAFFVEGQKFIHYIGESGIKVVTRLMGLILAIVGTQMFMEGAGAAVKMYK